MKLEFVILSTMAGHRLCLLELGLQMHVAYVTLRLLCAGPGPAWSYSKRFTHRDISAAPVPFLKGTHQKEGQQTKTINV